MNLLANVPPKQTLADKEFPKIYDFLAKEGPEHLLPTVPSIVKCEPNLTCEQILSNAAERDDGCMEKGMQQ